MSAFEIFFVGKITALILDFISLLYIFSGGTKIEETLAESLFKMYIIKYLT